MTNIQELREDFKRYHRFVTGIPKGEESEQSQINF